MTFRIERIRSSEPEEDARLMMGTLGASKKDIGEGSFATVYPLGTDRVVKYVYDTADDGYYDYIKLLARQRTHNPYTPVIDHVYLFKGTRAQGANYDTMLVVMEKLDLFSKRVGHRDAPGIASVIHDEVMRLIEWDNINRAAKQRVKAYQLLDAQATSAFAPNDHLKKAVGIIRKVHNSRGSILDLSHENLMFRGEQMVFTDPLA